MKRIAAWLLVCVMIVSSLPVAAFAEGEPALDPTPSDFCEVKAGTATTHEVYVDDANLQQANCSYDVLEAICNPDGTDANARLQCRICQVSFVGEVAVAEAHDYKVEEEGFAADCGAETNGKLNKAVCKNCGQVDPDQDGSISQWAHNYVAQGVEIKDHAGKVYYAEENACTSCGKVENVIDNTDNTDNFLKHYWNTTPQITIEPTCKAAGQAKYTCTQDGCGAVKLVVIKKIACLEREYVEAEPSTNCYSYGTIGYWGCEVCGGHYKEATGDAVYETISDETNGPCHSDNLKPTKDATAGDCVTHPTIAYWTCEKCDKVYSSANGGAANLLHDPKAKDDDNDDAIIEAAITLSGYGACPSRTFVAYKAATSCANVGNIDHWYCEKCGEGYASEVGGEPYANLGNTRPVCLNRTYNAPVASTSCTATGTLEYYECEVCDTCYKHDVDHADVWDAYADNDVSDGKYKAHTVGEQYVAKAPDCEKPGNPEYIKCSACNKYYAKVDGVEAVNNHTALESVEWATIEGYKALGHLVKEGHENHYTNTSWTNSTCKDGDALYDGQWIEANGECGTYQRKCARCNATYTEASTDHKYTDWAENPNATDCTKDGMIRNCIKCGEEETKAIDDAHAYETMGTLSYEFKAPDCLNPGYSRIVCSKCDAVWAVGYPFGSYDGQGVITTPYVNTKGELIVDKTGAGTPDDPFIYTLRLPTQYDGEGTDDLGFVDLNKDGKISNVDHYQGAYLTVKEDGTIAALGHDIKNGANSVTVYGSCDWATYTFTYCTRETCPLEKVTLYFHDDETVDDGNGQTYSLTNRYSHSDEGTKFNGAQIGDGTGYKVASFTVAETVNHNIAQFNWNDYQAAVANGTKDAYLNLYFWFECQKFVETPTCTTGAKFTITCLACQGTSASTGYIEGTELGHDFKSTGVIKGYTENGHEVYCSREGCVATSEIAHTYAQNKNAAILDEANVDYANKHAAKCDYCDYVGVTEHTFTKTSGDYVKPIEGDDVNHSHKCDNCAYVKTEKHEYTVYTMQETTAVGYTTQHKVSCACGRTRTAGENHAYGAAKTNESCVAIQVVNKDNTVTVGAWQSYSFCTDCAYIKVEGATFDDSAVVYETFEAAQAIHKTGTLTLVSGDPCGTENGTKIYTCNKCSNNVTIKVAAAHVFHETYASNASGVANKTVSFTLEDLTYAVCGKTYTCDNPGCGYSDVLKTHKYDSYVDFKAPTCSAVGNLPYYDCSGSQTVYVYVVTNNVSEWEMTVVDCDCIRHYAANGYEYDDNADDRILDTLTHQLEIVDSAALCSGVSYTHYACKNCSFSETAIGGVATQQPDVEQEYITGFSIGKHMNAAGELFATLCEAKFLGIEDTTCVRCNGEIEPGHTEDGDPTSYEGDCQNPAWSGHICGVCGETVKTEINDNVEDHVYGAYKGEGDVLGLDETDTFVAGGWVIISEGDLTQNGLKKCICQVCSDIKEEVIVTVEATYSLTVENANGGDVFTIGSTVKVTINLNTSGATLLSAVQAIVKYDAANLVFDKALMADGSAFLAPMVQTPADGYLCVGVGTANGMNTEINGDAAIVTLYFVVTGGIAEGNVSFTAADDFEGNLPAIEIVREVPEKTAYKTYFLNESGKDAEAIVKISATDAKAEIKISDWFDFNADGIVDIKDQQKVTQCVFGMSEYDVRFDVNKNGTIDAGEVPYMSQFINGEISAWEIFKLGLSDTIIAKVVA